METPILQMPPFPHINLSFFVNTQILLILFGIFTVFYFLFSAVLIFHWQSYGMKSPGVIFAESVYLFVSLILFVISGVSLYYF